MIRRPVCTSGDSYPWRRVVALSLDTGSRESRLVGVARQYCGQLRKQDNCQVAVTLSLASDHASLPIAHRLYLPQPWADDPARRSGRASQHSARALASAPAKTPLLSTISQSYDSVRLSRNPPPPQENQRLVDNMRRVFARRFPQCAVEIVIQRRAEAGMGAIVDQHAGALFGR